MRPNGFPFVPALALSMLLASSVAPRIQASPSLQVAEPDGISSGAAAAGAIDGAPGFWKAPAGFVAPPTPIQGLGLVPGPTWEAIAFDDNPPLNPFGFFYIPPDPHGAAGPDIVIDVVNAAAEGWTKTGLLLWRAGLFPMFTAGFTGGFPTLGTSVFDPKVIWDPYEHRFVIVALQRDDATLESRILLAVSKGPSPGSATAADWWFWCLDGAVTIGGVPRWSDYPGFEVDEEAVYITHNMFGFSGGPFGGVRLWILDKGVAGGLYSGGPAAFTLHDPVAATGGAALATTMMPAQVHGPGGAGPGIGTYLVSYSGIADGAGIEYLQVIRVNDPLGPVSMVHEFIPVGDIDTGGALDNAPQPGTAILINSNDRRALDAVWRDDRLWLVASNRPIAGPDAATPTAHFWEVSTAAVTGSGSPAGLLTLTQQGNAGGEDIAPGTRTYFPSIAVNAANEMKMGFAASGPTVFAGAYVTGRRPTDPLGTLRPTRTVHAGLDFYVRTFTAGSVGRNRWGDYTGISVDPVDDRQFWVFNQWADLRGTPFGGEDGRWGTVWSACSFECLQVSCPPDVSVPPGSPFVLTYCLTNCGPADMVVSLAFTGPPGWCVLPPVSVPIPAGATVCVPVACTVPLSVACASIWTFGLTATTPGGEVRSCVTRITADCATPTQIAMFTAEPVDEGARVRFQVADAGGAVGFDIFREVESEARTLVNAVSYTGTGTFELTDSYRSEQNVDYWLAQNFRDGHTSWHGPVRLSGRPAAQALSLSAPHPNPASARGATITFTLPASGLVRVELFDLAGRRVVTIADGWRAAGTQSVSWARVGADRRVPAGLYLVTLRFGEQTRTQRLLIRD